MALTVANLTIDLPGRKLIRPFGLTVAPGEIVTLMGASGSGKSSILSQLAGDLGPPFRATGDIVLDEQFLNGLPPERRGIGRLFQDDLLFPHMTVGENLLFAIPRQDPRQRLETMRQGLRRIEMEGFEHRPPHTLSGGQRSRVALMRALLAKPRAMLLDEPFGKLDAGLRETMRAYVFGHLRERVIPCLLVSHDRADAPAGGRVLVIAENGEVRDD